MALLGRARVGLGAHVVARRVVLRLHGRLAPRAHGAGRLVVAVVLLVPVAVVVVVPLVTTLVVEVRLRRCTSDWATNLYNIIHVAITLHFKAFIELRSNTSLLWTHDEMEF